MRDFINLVEALIKIGSNPAKAKVEAYLDELHSTTADHPMNPRLRLLSNAAVEVSSFDGMVHISDILALDPGKGGGKEALQFLCKLADKHGVKIHLTAKAYLDDRLSTAELKTWYERYGFTEEEDSFGDDHEGYDMIRYPS